MGNNIIQKENIKRILKRVEENTKTELIRIKTKISSRRLGITESKFGGIPYWPDIRTYPVSDKGISLTMLAQINLSDLPQNKVFPDKGLLQFFILNSKDPNNYRVVLHETLDTAMTPLYKRWIFPTSLMPKQITIGKDVRKTIPNLWWGNASFPVTGELALEFSKEYEYANLTEDCFTEEFIRAAAQLNISVPEEIDSVYYLLEEEDRYVFDKYFSGSGHKLLGRPYCIQGDYRDKEEVLLFQMDSVGDMALVGETDRYNYIALGDAGNMGFFIEKDKLKKLDFSEIYYTWACC